MFWQLVDVGIIAVLIAVWATVTTLEQNREQDRYWKQVRARNERDVQRQYYRRLREESDQRVEASRTHLREGR